MSDGPRLSVVLGTFNRLEALKRCLASIAANTRTPHVTYVTDAGSTDGTVEFLKSAAGDTVIPWLVGEKLGQAKAYNDVFKTLTTPYVVWISDDNAVTPGGLDAAVGILDRLPRVGMVGVKVKDLEGPFVSAPYIGGISRFGILNVNQGMLRREVLEAVGGFSETFGSYGIDPDITAKVLLAGHDIVYTRQVGLHHYRDWASDPSTAEYADLTRRQARSLEIYQRKYAMLGTPDPGWEAKKRVLKLIRRLPGYNADSPRPLLGGLPRDWENSFLGRFISPLDPWLSAGKPWRLRQRAPARLRPAALPADPQV